MMKFDPEIHQRRLIRLKGYDPSSFEVGADGAGGVLVGGAGRGCW